jgi:hypothetical protein
VACDPGARVPVLELPDRASDAPGGAEIARDIRTLDLADREERIYSEVSHGNVPTWLRRLRRVETVGEVGGREHRVTFWVTPDYLAVGSDSDYFLIPLSARTGQRIADLVGGYLPTPRMVNAIWSSAKARLTPIRIRPDEFISTVRYFEHHDGLVKTQRAIYPHARAGAFVAGHKLDVVLTRTVAANPGKVALYGWHLPDGRPIQPFYSTLFSDRLVLFSQGIRIVADSVLVDGVSSSLSDVLSDPELAPILSHEGVIARARYPVLNGER